MKTELQGNAVQVLGLTSFFLMLWLMEKKQDKVYQNFTCQKIPMTKNLWVGTSHVL